MGQNDKQEHPVHTHGVSADTSPRRLTIALALIVSFMIAEVVAGIFAHSLALRRWPEGSASLAHAMRLVTRGMSLRQRGGEHAWRRVHASRLCRSQSERGED